MNTAVLVVGVSLVIVLVIMVGFALVRRKWVIHRREETPEDRYRRAARDIRRLSDGPASDEPRIWPTEGGYSAS
jgi:hypothetical protein